MIVVVVTPTDGWTPRPAHAAAHFADPSVGGVQSLVRIYNRRRLLAWCQDVEFAVYGHLYQAGRNDWGTAGMGGNGQFNRLAALDDVADEHGPWRDRLTEDQDLGLRLIAAGWQGRQDCRHRHQQGLSALRPLFRQRTRWSQGNLQAGALTGRILRAPGPLGPRLEQMAYLLMPLWQGIIGASFAAAIAVSLLGMAPFWTAARCGCCCSSTCSPSAARFSAASPRVLGRAPSAGWSDSRWAMSMRSTPGCCGPCSYGLPRAS